MTQIKYKFSETFKVKDGKSYSIKITGTSLVVQLLRVCLSMQGTRFRALVREDPTYHGATKPVHHNY